MLDLHFAEPQWIHLLWGVLAFVGFLVWLDRRGGSALDHFVSTTLKARLLSGPGSGHRAARIAFLGAAGVFLTLALMRPQWGLQLVESRRAGAEIMICLDVSRSMLAEDVAPNRLERAKAEVRDLLAKLDGDQVGLIAFAGRASVLSPLTPDIGFLRLALDEASPASVTRGGTRLEEPIRKAIQGFGDSGEVSRSILLITDGEDQDSFPLEAAKAAAERGIRILAVGFGSESGTEIPITDPKTGARKLLRDADGAIVNSRLDGDLLREMALITGGAYIPAGTGVLDLDSIYERHIAPLTRGQLDGSTRAVRTDAFQWAVLLGLLALLAASMSSAGSRRLRGNRSHLSVTLMALTISTLALTSPEPVMGQQTGHDESADGKPETAITTSPTAGKTATDSGAMAPSATEETTSTEVAVPEDPRTAYNEGIAKLEGGDLEAAARLLESARAEAGSDGEARFRATYNLGWVEVSAADVAMEGNPQEALERLHRAAQWFREAVALRPEHEAARYNFEIVMRRALELADALAEHDEQNLRNNIDELIEEQRNFLSALRVSVAAQQAAANVNVSRELRSQFRELATRELAVLASAEQVSERASLEFDGINARSDNDRGAEDALRAARLEAVLGHLHHARERTAQARTRLRRMQGERAYRRASAALGAFRRARDQLLDPVARLDALLADGMEVAQLTGLKAAFERGLESQGKAATAPQWLTREYLAETQTRLQERTGELYVMLASALPADPETPGSQHSAAESASEAQQARALAQLRDATPHVDDARQSFEIAASALQAVRLDDALDAQRNALESLTEARELFLDLRRLIDRVYAQQQRVASLIAETPADEAGDAESPPQPAANPKLTADSSLGQEALTLTASLQERNIERTKRLDRMLSEAMVETLGPEELGASATASEAPDNAEKARLERAHELLLRAQDAMHDAARSFPSLAAAAADDSLADKALNETRSVVETSLTHLEALQRLFLSVIEHLRDTARRQQRLSDETEVLATLSDPKDGDTGAEKAGPLGHRQGILANSAQAISEALHAQASAPAAQDPDADDSVANASSERLSQAADLVAEAGTSMSEATRQLTAEPPALAEARGTQDSAQEALTEALALLENEEQSETPSDGQNEPQQSDAGAADEQPSNADETPGDTDLAQLLQGVRDREARRRDERARASNRQGYEPVEKDW